MFTVALVTTAKKWKRLKCPSMMDTQNEIYPYNEILFSLKKKMITHTITYMNLEDMLLTNESQKDQYAHFHFREARTQSTQSASFNQRESRRVVTRNRGERDWREIA